MSGVFESIAPPKWDYESIVPVVVPNGRGFSIWVHGLGDTPREIYAYLKFKRAWRTYPVGAIVPVELNKDGDYARSHSFSATNQSITLKQSSPFKITNVSQNASGDFSAGANFISADCELFVKARL